MVLSGGTLQAGAAGLTVANAAQVTGTGTIDTQSFALAYTGVISGPGQLDKTGTGKLTLSGPNSYSGGTLLQQGTLALGNAGALGAGPLAMGREHDAAVRQKPDARQQHQLYGGHRPRPSTRPATTARSPARSQVPAP